MTLAAKVSTPGEPKAKPNSIWSSAPGMTLKLAREAAHRFGELVKGGRFEADEVGHLVSDSVHEVDAHVDARSRGAVVEHQRRLVSLATALK